MRKIILNLAISLDGYISDKDGGFEWIVGHGDKDGMKAYDFESFLAEIDTIVMGARSYEDVILSGLSQFPGKRIIVATYKEYEEKENVTFIKGEIVHQILEHKKEKGKNIWLFGGAGLTDSFIRENVIDEYVIAIIPTILGAGRRLFKNEYNKIDLHLDAHNVSDGVAVLTYSKREINHA